MMIFYALAAHRLEGSQANVQRDFGGFNFAGMNPGKNLRGEMKAGGGSSDRSAFLLFGVDRLVAFAVGGRIFAGDVWRQRNVADFLNAREEIAGRRESNSSLAKAGAGDYVGVEFIFISEKQVFPDSNLSSSPDQALPFVGIPLQLAGEKDFDASVKKIPGRGIARTYGLRME